MLLVLNLSFLTQSTSLPCALGELEFELALLFDQSLSSLLELAVSLYLCLLIETLSFLSLAL